MIMKAEVMVLVEPVVERLDDAWKEKQKKPEKFRPGIKFLVGPYQ